MFGLDDRDIKIIQNIGKSYEGINQILVFGSRALENYKKSSDVDLAIVGDLEQTEIWAISGLLNDELLTPYFYDVVNFETITNVDLKNSIKNFGKVIYKKS